MEKEIIKQVSQDLSDINQHQIETTLSLLDEGNTVPFIARYRKERTGSLDEVQIRDIQDTYQRLLKLSNRKIDVINKIAEQGKLTDQLQNQIKAASDIQVVEDLYLPYKQKRKTKAMLADEQGLTPLANQMMKFPSQSPEQLAESYVNPAFGLNDVTEVLSGVADIITQSVADVAIFREWIRNYTEKNGLIVTKLKSKADELDENQVYANYYDFSETIKTIPSFRVLAINRGKKQKILQVKIDVNEDVILKYLNFTVIGKHTGSVADFVADAVKESYRKSIRPAITRDVQAKLTETAEEHAIEVFGKNLYHLLMQAPIKGKVTLGFDPAYRTGCKLAIMDKNGKFLHKQIIFATKPASEAKIAHAKQQFIDLINQYHVEMVAIGNGTASRESELFVADALKAIEFPVHYVIVNESGASVYSASSNARKEFPDLYVEERSAISIGRRLQDPLAELIKIDPKAVGVGQYQHDVSETHLDKQLDRVVETAVNQVGVNLNTASVELLEHISGLSAAISQNIVDYREENGSFTNRKQLKKVKRLGPKAYEQSVGFLRIIGGNNPLDNTDIHPESYDQAQSILQALDLSVDQLGTDVAIQSLNNVNPSELANKLDLDEQLTVDLLNGLKNPGRDLRDQMPAPLLKSDVMKIDDLKPGMKLQGTVRNVIDFGAFVDVGVKQDGLVHISHMSNKFIKDPAMIVSVGDIVDVWVLSVDIDRKRIQLSMIEPE
ncbi:RNA-binding transcriptional accessory protein [Fructilactobacillus sanfranciscensis]|uniref:Tex family protein n=1 Tax=Fructilactobacillus sanfranciscensis TaxID=1625 RepID=UPI000D4A49A5|nr:Tex family protein [Fructilactobacillus sanfranciscensis]POH13694.1 RNA-binding transcriptional accessory protein [Fructilactobacillus sanfranciscensis]